MVNMIRQIVVIFDLQQLHAGLQDGPLRQGMLKKSVKRGRGRYVPVKSDPDIALGTDERPPLIGNNDPGCK